ncbi:MAG: glycosyltransferase family 4 protein, partial [Planctomycetota bacterium]
GPLADSLKKQAHDNGTASHICFAGFQGNVAEIMNAFDIGCMPSRQEPFGIVALEMMSMNIPLICSTADGLTELAKDHQTALSLHENTPDEIASCILELNQDDNLKEQLKMNAMSFSRQFSVQQFTYKVNEIYRKIMSAG